MTDLSTIEELSEHEMNTEFTASSHRRHPSSGSGSNFPSAISQLTEPSGFASSGFHANNDNGRPPVIGESSYYSTGDEESYFPGENDEPEEAASYGPGAASSSRPPAASLRTTSGGSVPTVFTNEPLSGTSRTPSAKQVATTTGDRPARRWVLKTLLLLVVLVVAAVVIVVLLAGGESSASSLDENRDVPSPTLSPTTSAPTAVPTRREIWYELPPGVLDGPIIPTTEVPTQLPDTGHPAITDPTCPVRPPSIPVSRYVDYQVIWRGGVTNGVGVCDPVLFGMTATCVNGGTAVLLPGESECATVEPDTIVCNSVSPINGFFMRCYGEESQISLSLEIAPGSTQCVERPDTYLTAATAIQWCPSNRAWIVLECTTGGILDLINSRLIYCARRGRRCDGSPDEACELDFDGVALVTSIAEPACAIVDSLTRGEGEPCEFDFNCASDVCVSGLCRAGPGCIGADCETDDHCLGGGQCRALECTDGET